jgi:hypothetical protein
MPMRAGADSAPFNDMLWKEATAPFAAKPLPMVARPLRQISEIASKHRGFDDA